MKTEPFSKVRETMYIKRSLYIKIDFVNDSSGYIIWHLSYRKESLLPLSSDFEILLLLSLKASHLLLLWRGG